jgi:1-deoxy-D-xylulose-5-phosphate reductoisomerase
MSRTPGSLQKIAVLGSTGSIGRQTLDIMRTLPDKFKIVGLAAGENLGLLEKQVNEFEPEMVYYQKSNNRLNAGKYKFVPMEELAAHPDVDVVVIATSGNSGLSSVLAAIRANKKIALANKEPLVMAGDIVLAELKKSRARILPVDSEHSAIWQCISGETQKPERIILTASGGPFLRYPPAQLAEVTVEQALQHPSWQMGAKVTLDSATLMNKGLEVIEAHWLFDMPYEKIDVLIHPQSIVHSMIELVDGSLKAQLSYPDMRLAIQYALSYPERLSNPTLPRLDWSRVRGLTFEQPNYNVFPCLKLAVESGRAGRTFPAVLCGADEVAVDLFLHKQIPFTDIARLVEEVLKQHQPIEHPGLEDILTADCWAREQARRFTGGVKPCLS